MDQDALKSFLNSLSEILDQEKIELFNKIIDSSKIEEFNDPEEFFLGVLYPWEKFISGLLKTSFGDNSDVEFIYRNSQFIDHHFNNLFSKYEGMACCSDKSRMIVKRLVDFYISGEKIEFDYDAEYTFHLPKKIFKNHDDIVGFYEGLRGLNYGNPTKYLEELKKVLTHE